MKQRTMQQLLSSFTITRDVDVIDNLCAPIAEQDFYVNTIAANDRSLDMACIVRLVACANAEIRFIHIHQNRQRRVSEDPINQPGITVIIPKNIQPLL